MQDEVTVTQADREAAYGAYFECYDTAPNDLWLQAMLEGRHDEDSLIQVLARHRHQAERDVIARMEVVAVVGNNWRLLWASGETLTAIVQRTGIKIGSPLYALPTPPAQTGEGE